MSEVKPVEPTDVPSTVAPVEPVAAEPVVAPPAETTEAVVAPEATAEGAAAPEADAEAPAVETTAEAVAPEAPKEVEPITEGTLETKISILPLFLKKYTFHLTEDAVPEEHLAEFLKKEKTKTAYEHYAHATQTGKGLLFYGKTPKSTAGIIRLDGAEVTKQGERKFTIKSPGHEIQLEAATSALRERWVHTLNAKITEYEGIHALTAAEEGFKSVLDKLTTKPSPAAAVAKDKKKEEPEPVKEGETEEEDKKAKKAAKKKEKEEKKAAGEEVEDSSASSAEEETGETAAAGAAKAEKKEEKKRSSSRNRFSFLGIKKHVVEKKDEETPAPVPVAPAPIETSAEATTEADKEVTEEAKLETSPVTSPKSNRKSFLGLFSKKEKKADAPAAEEAAKSDAAPESEATEALASTSEPQTADPLPDAVEPEAAAVAVDAPKEAEPVVEATPGRKPSLFGSLRGNRDKSADGTDGSKPGRTRSFWKKDKEKKPAGKEESPAIAETDAAAAEAGAQPLKTEPALTEALPAAVPDAGTAAAAETEVVDGKIGDVVPAAVTVGGESSKA
ncbi:hypothetical protein DRE_01369 [Drechslerella stenobrocha 248]|uniref:PH domain-containing protein n=1 Tax=Drechslerella stenobrocha 248 TaxID=1043628 RepID=W7HVE1_9PEZI|nr:hypothetical protein DRE_01369 [Drechslerella stenobrocha 248]